MNHEIIYAPVSALVQAIRAQSLSSEAVVTAYLRQIALINPR